MLGAMAALTVRPAFAQGVSRSAGAYPFALGVASGDPARDGFVLWTRLVGPGGAALDAGAVHVRFEIAEDQQFRRVVRSGMHWTSHQRAHSVHIEVEGLDAGRRYWYRFHGLGATSPVGRTATVPIQTARFRLALSSCQHWEQGWFGAYRDMIAADPDLIVQLGDYIYEQTYPGQPVVRTFGSDEPIDLEGYRARHALYRTDPDLQEAHRLFPWAVIWDDHEVLNDYASLANREGVPPGIFAARRAAAYQAYFEHMPLRPSLWGSPSAPQLYRAIDWGELASLSLLDTRQYRSSPPCSPPFSARNVRLVDCHERFRADRTMLGSEQETWLAGRMANERRPWTLLAQGIFFAPLSLDGSGQSVFSDQWDGYAAARGRIMKQLVQPAVSNAFVLSGDVHSFWVNELRPDADAREGPPVATEIVTSALAAQSPPEGRFGDALVNNSHIRYSNVERSGYVLADITQHAFGAALRSIDRHSLRPKAQVLAKIIQERSSSKADVIVERPGAKGSL